MKIGYVGNFQLELGEKAFSTEAHIYKTLRDMGHDVIRFQENQITGKSVLDAVDTLADPIQYLQWTRTWNFDGDKWLLDELRKRGIPSVSLHMDLYAPIQRGENLKNDPFWLTDFVFSPDNDPSSVAWFEAIGASHFYSPPGVLKQECYIADPDLNRFPHPIVFVGSYDYHPEHEWYRRKLIDWLRSTYADKFMRYPNDSNPCVRGHDLNTLYASAKIVVGDALCKNFTHTKYWSDRVPETLSRGNALLIHPHIVGLDDYYKDGEHLVYYKFDDFVDLKNKIDYYLEHEAARHKIAMQGHVYNSENHTYHQRLQNLINVVIFNQENQYK